MVESNQHNYEVMFILDDTNQDKVAVLKKELVEILTKNNGTITKEDNFVRQFAYEINHKVKGHYFVLEVKTTSENIDNFNRIFLIKQKQGEVIRKLVINLDDEKINTFKPRKERPVMENQNRDFRPRRNPEGQPIPQTGTGEFKPTNRYKKPNLYNRPVSTTPRTETPIKTENNDSNK